jgi:hypothetical protein
VRLRLAVLFVLAAVAQAHGQQTVTVPPPPPPLPSTFPQFQTYAGCLMTCDITANTCRSACSVNNSPAVTFATPPTAASPSATRIDPTTLGLRADAGMLGQCYLTCSSQVLTCKQACTPPH